MKLLIAALLLQATALLAQEKNCDVRTTGTSEEITNILKSKGYNIIESAYFEGGYVKNPETGEIKYVNAYWENRSAGKSTYQLNDKRKANSLGGTSRELIFVGDGIRIERKQSKYLNPRFGRLMRKFHRDLRYTLQECPY